MATGSSGKLVDTTFNTKPDDQLNVVDIYNNSSSGIENSFQALYHNANSAFDDFAAIGQSVLGGIGSAVSTFNKAIAAVSTDTSKINSVLRGIKSGNISSLIGLTGGASSGLKQISDIINDSSKAIGGITKTVNSIDSIGNTLKGGLNNTVFLNGVASNVPLARQIKQIIRGVGTIDSNADSLQKSLGKASTILGGDYSSINTVYKGTDNVAASIQKPTKFDTNVTTQQTNELINNIKTISPEISSAITSLPVDTQKALVRGFSNDSVSKGIFVSNNNTVTQTNAQVSADVIKPINSIINSFTGETSDVKVQDGSAVSVLISGVSNIANKAGMKGTFTKITDNIDNQDVIVAAAKPLVVRAIEEGDLDTIIDLSNSKAAKDIGKFSPNLVAGVNYNVQRQDGMSQQEFAPYYESVKRAFNAIDSNWTTYYTGTGKNFVDGTCISSNSFLCDLIEAKLNDNNNTAINNSNRQVVNTKNLNSDSIISVQNNEPVDTFSQDLERQIDTINKEVFVKAAQDGSTIVIPPVPAPAPPAPAPTPSVPILDYSDEPYLLLASVFIDNSVESEIEKHFPYLNERFKVMGTYNR